MLAGVPEDGSHAVLDLGPATEPSLRVYSRYARRIRFADVVGDEKWPHSEVSPVERLRSLPAQPEHPYDLVFAWDVLDRLFPQDYPCLVERLVELTAPHARLHVVVRAPEESSIWPLRFALLGTDRIRYQPTGTLRYPRTGVLPADVAHVLAPFRIVRGFTLKGSLREYVAVRSPAAW